MSTREGFSQFSLSWWLCAHSKLGRTKSARKLPKQKHSPPFCFQFLPLDVTGKTQKFQDKFESDLFGRFWGHMYTHDIRTIWKVIVINVLIVISWTFLVTPHSFRVLITIEQGIAVGCSLACFQLAPISKLNNPTLNWFLQCGYFPFWGFYRWPKMEGQVWLRTMTWTWRYKTWRRQNLGTIH